MRKPVVVALVCTGAMLSGCAIVDGARIDSAGVPVKSEDGFQSVDLPLAVDPAGHPSPNADVNDCIRVKQGVGCTGVGTVSTGPSLDIFRSNLSANDGTEDAEEIVERLRLATAYYNFYNAPQQPGQSLEDRRNSVQDTLMGASDMNCAIFTQRVYGIQATGNFALGSLATVFGAAGAIVTDVDAARLLSGMSAATAGIRAEMNEDFFRKQWIEALVKSIENERNRVRAQIETSRAQKTISQYSVQAAVRDALLYNEACSLVSGLKEVNRAVAIADDPAGLRAFRDTYARAGFEASFSATVTSSDRASSSRVRPVTSATASVALNEIAGDVAEARALVAQTMARIEGYSDVPDSERNAAKGKIDPLFAELYKDTDPKNYGDRLKAYVEQLRALQTSYDGLRDALATSTDEKARERTQQLMAANDAASELIRRAARDAVIAIEGDIKSIADKLQPKPKVPT